MPKFTVHPIDLEQAMKQWRESSNASVFTNPLVLSILAEKLECWGCFEDQTLIATWPVTLDKFGQIYLPDFTYYVGPVFSEKFYLQPNHRKLSTLNSIYSAFLQAFKAIYHNICLNTNALSNDIRFFLWENYEIKKHEPYKITPRYTAKLNNLHKLTEDQIKSGFRPARRRQLKKALAHSFSVSEMNHDFNIPKIKKMYADTLNRQNLSVTDQTFRTIEKLLSSLPEENIYSISITENNSSNLVFFSLIMHAKETANLVLNLTDPEFKNTNVSVLGVFESILTSKRIGCHCFDFNGANSPNRADDKHSYGAELDLFFHIEGAW